MAPIVLAEADMTRDERINELLRSARRVLASGCESLTLDLSRTRLADSRVVAALCHIAAGARARCVRLEIRCSRSVGRWLEVLGVPLRWTLAEE